MGIVEDAFEAVNMLPKLPLASGVDPRELSTVIGGPGSRREVVQVHFPPHQYIFKPLCTHSWGPLSAERDLEIFGECTKWVPKLEECVLCGLLRSPGSKAAAEAPPDISQTLSDLIEARRRGIQASGYLPAHFNRIS